MLSRIIFTFPENSILLFDDTGKIDKFLEDYKSYLLNKALEFDVLDINGFTSYKMMEGKIKKIRLSIFKDLLITFYHSILSSEILLKSAFVDNIKFEFFSDRDLINILYELDPNVLIFDYDNGIYDDTKSPFYSTIEHRRSIELSDENIKARDLLYSIYPEYQIWKWCLPFKFDHYTSFISFFTAIGLTTTLKNGNIKNFIWINKSNMKYGTKECNKFLQDRFEKKDLIDFYSKNTSDILTELVYQYGTEIFNKFHKFAEIQDSNVTFLDENF